MISCDGKTDTSNKPDLWKSELISIGLILRKCGSASCRRNGCQAGVTNEAECPPPTARSVGTPPTPRPPTCGHVGFTSAPRGRRPSMVRRPRTAVASSSMRSCDAPDGCCRAPCPLLRIPGRGEGEAAGWGGELQRGGGRYSRGGEVLLKIRGKGGVDMSPPPPNLPLSIRAHPRRGGGSGIGEVGKSHWSLSWCPFGGGIVVIYALALAFTHIEGWMIVMGGAGNERGGVNFERLRHLFFKKQHHRTTPVVVDHWQ